MTILKTPLEQVRYDAENFVFGYQSSYEPTADGVRPWIPFLEESIRNWQINETEALSLISGLAWRSRALNHPIRDPGTGGTLLEVADYAARLRYDFLLDDLVRIADDRPKHIVDHEMTQSYIAFGIIGSAGPDAAPGSSAQILDQALDSAPRDSTRAFLLHAVWVGVGNADQDTLADKAFGSLLTASANEHFWYGSCLRRAGRYSEAMAHIREALRLHGGDSLIYQDYMREFELTVSLERMERRLLARA